MQNDKLFYSSQGAQSIQLKFQPVRPGKVVDLKEWTRFFETFPVGPNRSIEFWTEISRNFGWMGRAQGFSYLQELSFAFFETGQQIANLSCCNNLCSRNSRYFAAKSCSCSFQNCTILAPQAIVSSRYSLLKPLSTFPTLCFIKPSWKR